ncbi:303aa long hypothetical protein [Pyrococcus horikoshii OT3]|uniref:Uncharacterized protein n=1 Tax=Pyrococcus horikoshii (strain ATCC 700860 / DSM 12428 / JCM 9974 / NBRC 100139 / OT-3) TaxID=70601 RepID=O58380_PYRHO|nr:303aa long hypothetical protein [Pyrococcus horikoshii OT3]
MLKSVNLPVCHSLRNHLAVSSISTTPPSLIIPLLSPIFLRISSSSSNSVILNFSVKASFLVSKILLINLRAGFTGSLILSAGKPPFITSSSKSSIGTTPGVSKSQIFLVSLIICLPFVYPGIGAVPTECFPLSTFIIVLFPTFGYPINATLTLSLLIIFAIFFSSLLRIPVPFLSLAEIKTTGISLFLLYSSAHSLGTKSALFITNKSFLPLSKTILSSFLFLVPMGSLASTTSTTMSASSITSFTIAQAFFCFIPHHRYFKDYGTPWGIRGARVGTLDVGLILGSKPYFFWLHAFSERYYVG